MEKGDVIGRGRTAEVIYWGNNKVLKLFYEKFSNNMIDYEYKVNTLIDKIFPNCAKAHEKVEENGRIGILYQYLKGITLTEFMKKKNKNVGKGMRILAEIHADMHKHKITDINSQKDTFNIAIHQTNLLDDDQKKKISKYIEKLPDGTSICHRDLHPENVIMSKNKLYVVDWPNTVSGNQYGDVARTFYLLKYGLSPSDEYTLKKSFVHRFFFKAIKSRLAKIYLKHYIKLTDSTLKEIKKWDLAIYTTHLHEPVPLEYENLLKMITNLLKHHK